MCIRDRSNSVKVKVDADISNILAGNEREEHKSSESGSESESESGSHSHSDSDNDSDGDSNESEVQKEVSTIMEMKRESAFTFRDRLRQISRRITTGRQDDASDIKNEIETPIDKHEPLPHTTDREPLSFSFAMEDKRRSETPPKKQLETNEKIDFPSPR
eukprot:TRINITY_DN10088_c0_g1_i2.p2 TRINITY_DN10088_c0_g1~~TRINITY_DN10088_c0_g1_i2.p2  ORF type:complete len:188 (-),score=35.37 TRINITY_DN10088_c0_g1_i2:405-884(-)